MEGTKVPKWRISKSSLVELVGETADAVGTVTVRVWILCLKFALREQVQESAIDRVVQVEFDLSAWRLYLFHPCQAIRSLLYGKHFSCVLLHGAVAFPKLQSCVGAVRFDVGTKVRGSLFSKRVLKCGKMLTVANGCWHIDHHGTPLIADGSPETSTECFANFSGSH